MMQISSGTALLSPTVKRPEKGRKCPRDTDFSAKNNYFVPFPKAVK